MMFSAVVTAVSQTSGSAGEATLPWNVEPSVWLVMGGVVTFLWWAVTRIGPTKVAVGEAVITRRQKQWMAAGVVSMWIFSEYPIHDISEKYLFMVHMTQHTIFTMVSSACFLMGAPDWMWRWVLSNTKLRRAVKFLSKPMIALLVFNALIAYTHLPVVVNLATSNGLFHFTIHASLFVSSLFMWVPVINRTELLPKLKKPTKMVYLFAQSLVPTVPASFLTFSQKPMYKTYAEAPRLIKGVSAVTDQQVAAVIMKLGAGTYIWCIVGYLFYSWWKDNEAGVADDNMRVVPKDRGLGTGVLTWDRVQVEFDKLDAAKPGSGTPVVGGPAPSAH
jgi:putative membrane protein